MTNTDAKGTKMGNNDTEAITMVRTDAEWAEFYGDDEIWDHEFCAPGDVCSDSCPYSDDYSPDQFTMTF